MSGCCVDIDDQSFNSIVDDYVKMLHKRLKEIEAQKRDIERQLEEIRKKYKK